jgi:hypothetical protein
VPQVILTIPLVSAQFTAVERITEAARLAPRKGGKAIAGDRIYYAKVLTGAWLQSAR